VDKTKIVIYSLLGVGILAIIFSPGFRKVRQLARENRQLEEQITQVTRTNVELREEYKKLKNDPVYLEKVARDKLGVARKGEIVYQVVPEEEEKQ
jgi:cell division protein FtsB